MIMNMKSRFIGGMILAAAALLCFSSCKKENDEGMATLDVAFENSANQKVYYDWANDAINWNAGDKVKINGSEYTVTSGKVEVNAKSTGYAAVYPSTQTGVTANSGTGFTTGNVTIPTNQTYTVSSGKQIIDARLAARLDTKEGTLKFRNMYAVVHVTIMNDAGTGKNFTCNSIEVIGESQNLSGKVNFTLSGNTATTVPGITSVSEGKKNVKMTFSSPLAINGAAKPASEGASLVVAPFSSQKVTVKVRGSLNGQAGIITMKTSAAHALSRSHCANLTVKVSDFQPDYSIGEFTVNSDGLKVGFTSGNLQYHEGSDKWRLAQYQYSYIGAPGYVTPAPESATQTGNVTGSDNRYIHFPTSGHMEWIDLFGWATSGYKFWNGQQYMPWEWSGPGYMNFAPENKEGTNYNLQGDYAKGDWGYYNTTVNQNITKYDGTTFIGKGWRTLTQPEWDYMLKTRKVKVGGSNRVPYGLATVCGVHGLIILPDNWDGSANSSFSYGTNGYGSNNINSTLWNTMETAGCVFLPASGLREPVINGTTFTTSIIRHTDAAGCCLYWSATKSGNKYHAYYCNFNNSNVHTDGQDYYLHTGMAVRLVRDK